MSKYKLKFIGLLRGNICTGWRPQPAVLRSISQLFSFLKMPSVFWIFMVFADQYLFSVDWMRFSLLPLSFTDPPPSYLLFNRSCSFVSLPQVSSSPSSISLPGLAHHHFVFSPLSWMIDATIYFPWEPRGIWAVALCVCVWIVCCTNYSREELTFLNIQPTSASDTGNFTNRSWLSCRQTGSMDS